MDEKLSATDFGLTGKFFRRELGKYIAIAESDQPILVTGETGTGKTLLANALHKLSLRKEEKFSALSLAEVSGSLFESSLFGHKKGSFTGATKDNVGVAKNSNKGTLFLDEIGDAPPEFQVKILRLIEQGVIFPVGGKEEETLDVRIIAATNRDLEEMVNQSDFRKDLFHRLSTFCLDIPPLRERPEEIPDLAIHFMLDFLSEQRLKGLFIEFPRWIDLSRKIDELIGLPLEGNARELRTLIIRWLTLPLKKSSSLKFSEEELVDLLIQTVADKCSGDISLVAERLDLTFDRARQVIIENESGVIIHRTA